MKLSRTQETTLLFLSKSDLTAPNSTEEQTFTHEILKRYALFHKRIIHLSPKYKDCKREETIDNVTYLRMGNTKTVEYYALYYYLLNYRQIHYVISKDYNVTKFIEASKQLYFLPTPPIKQQCSKSNVIVDTKELKEDLVRQGFKEDKLFILHGGICATPYVKYEFQAKERATTFVCEGTKGAEDCLRAFGEYKKRFSDSKLWIMGESNTKLETLCNHYQLSYGKHISCDVVYYPNVEHKLKLISKAHFYLTAHTTEQWDLLITASAVVGTPTIAYKSQGTLYATNNGKAGRLCSSNNYLNMLDEMVALTEEPTDYLLLQDSAYTFSKPYQINIPTLDLDNALKS